MLFAARISNLTVTIRNAKVKNITNEDDITEKQTVRPQLDAVFHARRLTEAQRIIADRMFKAINPENPYGSAPYLVGDAMGSEFSTEDVMAGTRYVGFDPSFNIGKFDSRTDIEYESQGCETDEQCSELKKLVEKTLLEGQGLGSYYVRLDERLPKPWASYPMENGQGVAQKVVATARDIGVPLTEIIDFEKTQDEPKKGVISLCEAELAKEHEAAVEDEALGAVIPG